MAAKSKAKFPAKAAPSPPRAPAAGDSFWASLSPDTRQKLLLALQIIVIVEAAIWVFSPVLKNGWYADDTLYITTNPLLHQPDRLWKAWFAPGSFVDYYPLEQTVQWLQWLVFGQGSPFWYLVCNLALHAASALLLWRLFARLGLRFAWLGGLLFAIYPLFVDSVGNATELKNTLSLPPLLLALAAWIDFDQTRRPRDYALALGLYLVAMLCKITAYFVPIVLLLYAWWKRGKITRFDCLAAAPFLLVSVPLSLLHLHAGVVYAAHTHYISPGPIHLGGIGERLELAGQSLAFYFGHAFLPLRPMPYYPLWDLDPLTLLGFLPWLGIVLVLAVCWIKRSSWGRPVFLSLAFFALGLAPFLGLNQVSYMCLFWVQDHMLYLPVIALIGLVIAGVEGLAGQIPHRLRTAGIGLLALIVALLGAETHSYATLFADQEQLYRYNLSYNPNSWMLHNLLGNQLGVRDDLVDATREYRESVRLNPAFDNAQMSLGVCLFKTGDNPGAIDAFQRCLAVDPGYGAARLFLGFAFAKEGRLDDSVAQFRALIKNVPDFPPAHMGLGQVLALQGHLSEALAELQTAQQLDPTNGEIQAQIAALQARQPPTPPVPR